MMNTIFRNCRRAALVSGAMLLYVAAGALAADIKVTLSGDQEVPAVKTPATGSGTISVGDDKSVEGSVRTVDMVGSMAHIHEAAPGIRGGIVVGLSAPDGTGHASGCRSGLDPELITRILTNPAGFYVNVHTTVYPLGAIRGQLDR